MSAQDWSPTPWQWHEARGFCLLSDSKAQYVGEFELFENGERALRCVNAMAGMDPVALVELEGELLDIVWTVINEYGDELDESLLARAKAAFEGHGKVLLPTESGE